MKRKFLIILSAMCMAVSLTGCGDSGGISGETAISSESTEAVLPPNMTMDDLLNMIRINGKTLTMPTTLNDIMALGDEFSYKMAFSEVYKTPEDSINNAGGVFYDIFYNEERICQIVILEDDYTGDVLDSPIKKFSNGFGADIEQCGITFSLSDRINMNSTVDEVIEVFGEPNYFPPSNDDTLGYVFYDENIEYKIRFVFASQDNKIIPNEMISILISFKN